MAMRIPLFSSQRALKIQYQTIQIFDFADPVVAGIRDRIRVRSRGQKLVYTYNKSVKKLCLYIEYIKKIIIGWGLETVMEHKSKKKIMSVCLYVCLFVHANLRNYWTDFNYFFFVVSVLSLVNI